MKTNPFKRIALAFVVASLMSSAAQAASAVAGAVAIVAISGVTLLGTAALGHPIRDVLRKQATDFSNGADNAPGKELTDVFVLIRKNPGYERYSDKQLSEEVLAALDADPIQN